MKTATLRWIVLALALGGAAWWLVFADEPSAEPAPIDAAAAAADAPPVPAEPLDTRRDPAADEPAAPPAATPPPVALIEHESRVAPTDATSDVTIRVVDVDDRPIAGAQVHFEVREKSSEAKAAASFDATTGADGVVHFAAVQQVWGPRDNMFRDAYVVRAAGFAEQHGMIPSRDATVALRPGTDLAGRVIVAGTGAPVAFASIELQVIGRGWLGPPPTSTTTDARGEFLVTGLSAADTHRVVVRRAGHAPFETSVDTRTSPRPPERGTLEVPRGVDVHLVLLDATTGAPVAGAILAIGNFEVTRSDATGRATILDLGPGKASIHIVPLPPWLATGMRIAAPADLAATEHTILVERGCTVAGRLLDPRGEPVAGATLTLRAEPQKPPEPQVPATPDDDASAGGIQMDPGRWSGTTAETDDRGAFRVGSLRARDPIRVSAVMGKSDLQLATVPALEPGAEHDLGTLVLPDVGALTVFVRRGGFSANGARVVVEAGERRFEQVLAGGRNWADFPEVPPGSARVTAEWEGRSASATVEVMVGAQSEVALDVEPEMGIATMVRVMTHGGKAMAVAKVDALFANGGKTFNFTDTAGVLVLRSLPEWGDIVALTAGDLYPSAPVQAAAGSEVVLRIARVRDVEVAFTDASGATLAPESSEGGEVVVEVRVDAERDPVIMRVKPDASGAARLRLPAGEVELSVRRASSPAESATVLRALVPEEGAVAALRVVVR